MYFMLTTVASDLVNARGLSRRQRGIGVLLD
jgi:hypothetical protein